MKSRQSFDSCFISAWAFAVAAFCFQMGAQAQTSVSLYKGPITGSSPENPVDFSVTSYWDPAGMPSGTTAEAKFAKATMGTLTEQMYVALPNNLTLLTLRAGGGKIINFIGENVSLGTLHYHDYLGYASVLYATAHAFGNDISSVCGAFAGDVVNAISGKMVFAGGEVEHHHHCYANSDSETILNALPTNFWTHGTANLHLYASRQCGEVTGFWKATKDSKYLKYVGASAIHVVAPGAKVTCPGIVPTGAYVRRWFSNAKTIELSAAALDNADSTNLTFHAYNPSVRQDVVTWQKQGGTQNDAILNKWSTGQNAVLEVDTLQGGSGSNAITFDAEGNCYPWRVIIHNGKILSAVNFKYADIEFADNPSGVRGLPNSAVSVTSSSKSSTVTVPGGENTAYFKTFGPIAAGGGLIKKGAGALVAKLGDDLFGSLEVAEGSVSFTNAVDTAKIYELGSLTLGAGTVFNVDGGVTLNVKMISVGTGARITGTGTIAFPNPSMIPEGVIASSVKIGIAGVSGGLVHGEIVPAVVGDPAFWLDTAAADSLVTEENGAVTNVVRWNDCRKASPDDGYMFATNCWAKPTLANMLIQNYTHRSEGARINSFNRNYVRIVANPASLAHCEALVWSRKLTGIKSVFLVMSAADGGGCVLGNTAKLGDFGRGATGQAAIFYSGTDASPEKVYKAPMYINGVKVVNHFTFGPYTGFPNNWRPFLFEVHPTADGGEADAFGMQGTNRLDLVGGQRIFECILYTNELTRTEQAQVADYLTRKWFNACYGGAYALDEAEETIDATTFDRLDIVSGDYAVEAITGTSFVKTGAGGMYVASLTGGTDLTIPEGSMVISSAKAASFANLPVDDSGVYMHLDANNLEGSTMSEIDGKGECVKIWKSLRGATLRTATNFSTNHPALKTTGGSARMKDGMKYVDLGEFREVPTTTGYGTVNANCGETYHFVKSDGIRAMFMVFGGTGPLVGNNGIYQNYGEGGLYRGDNAAALGPAAPLIYPNGWYANSYSLAKGYCTYVKVNGVETDPTTTGLDNDLNVISLRTYIDPVSASAFNCIHYNNKFGGAQYGEVMFYTRPVSRPEAHRIETYLRNKWCREGYSTAGYEAAVAGKVMLGTNAMLKVVGGEPLTATGLGGGGTVTGDVTLQNNAELTVVITDGVASSQTIEGELVLPVNGTVKVVGDFTGLAFGDFDVFKSASIHASTDLSGWGRNLTQVVHPEKRNVSFKAVEGAIRMTVSKSGTTFILR